MDLQIIEHQNQRVLSTQQLAESYGTDRRVISNNFSRNKGRYVEGKHYYLLKGDTLKNFKGCHQIDESLKSTSILYLWTERGAFLHAKSLNTDKAWEVYDSLVEHYFNSKEAKPNALPTNYKEALLQLVAQVEANEKLELECRMKDQQLGELKPKADYCDLILQSKALVNISQIAKDYGMSGKAMNKLLHDLGVQYKQSNQWLLYSKYQNSGYTHSKTIDITRCNGLSDVRMHTEWTQKGRLFLYELLKRNGVIPVIER
jgi:phage antirepressor YoqD-like protein